MAGQDGVADGVDPAVHAVKPSSAEAVGDRVVVEAQFAQLLPRDNAMLARREPRDRRVRRG
jgi:hypothetical protein